MSKFHFLQLNDDCLHAVCKYLSLDDRFNVSQVCTRLRQLVHERPTPSQKIEFDFEDNPPKRQLLLESRTIIELHVKGSHGKEDCEMLSRSIQRMIKLERLIIKLISALDDCCFCKQSLFKASSQLPILRILELTSGAACLEALRSFRHLEELTLHINNINAGHLMECCKSNTKLRVLKLCGSGAEGSLEGIAALCNNVEELEILLESNRDYSPFAKLLNLKRLTIYCAQSDLARRFLNGFSTEKLEEIELFRKIYGITDLKLSKKIVSMKALKYLDGYFNDTKCLELLTQLHDLEELFIDVWYDGGFSSSILKIVQVCRKLQILHVGGESFKGNEFVFKVLEVLKKVRDPTTQKPLLLELEHCTALTATEMQKIDHAYLDLYIINYEDYSDTDVLMIV